jgi:hypothetical protein
MEGAEEKRRNTFQQLDGKVLFHMLLDYGRITQLCTLKSSQFTASESPTSSLPISKPESSDYKPCEMLAPASTRSRKTRFPGECAFPTTTREARSTETSDTAAVSHPMRIINMANDKYQSKPTYNVKSLHNWRPERSKTRGIPRAIHLDITGSFPFIAKWGETSSVRSMWAWLSVALHNMTG